MNRSSAGPTKASADETYYAFIFITSPRKDWLHWKPFNMNYLPVVIWNLSLRNAAATLYQWKRDQRQTENAAHLNNSANHSASENIWWDTMCRGSLEHCCPIPITGSHVHLDAHSNCTAFGNWRKNAKENTSTSPFTHPSFRESDVKDVRCNH